MIKKYLITTPLEEKIYSNKKNKILLGDWCLDYKFFLEKTKRSKTLKNRWDNYNLRKKDYIYLKKIFFKLLNSIPNKMNIYHKTKHKKEFWKLLLWVWLSYYIPIQYFRWKTINDLIKKNKNITYLKDNSNENIVPNETIDLFDVASNSDFYNFYLFNRILKSYKGLKFDINKPVTDKVFSYLKKMKVQKIKSNKIKNFFNIFLNSLFNKYFNKNNISIFGGFSFLNVLKLNFRLSQIPAPHEIIFKRKDFNHIYFLSKKEILKRQNLNLKQKINNNFEKYLNYYLSLDIPSCYLENFKNRFDYIKNININPKLILAGGEHFHHELYKLWIIYLKLYKNKKIFSFEHGGNHSRLRWEHFYDYFLSNKVIHWDKKYNKLNLPVAKYINYDKKRKKNTKYLLYVGYEIRKYPTRLYFGEKSLTKLKNYKNITYMKSNLKSKIFGKMKYSQKELNDSRLNKILKILLNKNKIIKPGGFFKHLRQSKIVVCDYPQTAFIDALLTGPTILICSYKDDWEPRSHFTKSYEILMKNKILFTDVAKMTSHINRVWDNPNSWWNSKKTKKAVSQFLEKFSIETSSKGINDWGKTIESHI